MLEWHDARLVLLYPNNFQSAAESIQASELLGKLTRPDRNTPTPSPVVTKKIGIYVSKGG